MKATFAWWIQAPGSHRLALLIAPTATNVCSRVPPHLRKSEDWCREGEDPVRPGRLGISPLQACPSGQCRLCGVLPALAPMLCLQAMHHPGTAGAGVQGLHDKCAAGLPGGADWLGLYQTWLTCCVWEAPWEAAGEARKPCARG